MDVLADGAWENIFKVKPPVFTPFYVYSPQVYNILAYFAGKSAKRSLQIFRHNI